jgi:hypothetical protein
MMCTRSSQRLRIRIHGISARIRDAWYASTSDVTSGASTLKILMIDRCQQQRRHIMPGFQSSYHCCFHTYAAGSLIQAAGHVPSALVDTAARPGTQDKNQRRKPEMEANGFQGSCVDFWAHNISCSLRPQKNTIRKEIKLSELWLIL